MLELDFWGNIAAIGTAVGAAALWGHRQLTHWRRMRAVEDLLAERTQPHDAALTVDMIGLKLGLTESQVIEAAARSKRIDPDFNRRGYAYTIRKKR